MPIICDFCSSPEVKWSFSGEDSEVIIGTEDKVYHQLNEGDWASCDCCHDLILADKQEELIERSYKTFLELHGKNLSEDEKRFVRPMIKVIHRAFWENMSGKCQRVLIAEFKAKGGENL